MLGYAVATPEDRFGGWGASFQLFTLAEGKIYGGAVVVAGGVDVEILWTMSTDVLAMALLL